MQQPNEEYDTAHLSWNDTQFLQNIQNYNLYDGNFDNPIMIEFNGSKYYALNTTTLNHLLDIFGKYIPNNDHTNNYPTNPQYFAVVWIPIQNVSTTPVNDNRDSVFTPDDSLSIFINIKFKNEIFMVEITKSQINNTTENWDVVNESYSNNYTFTNTVSLELSKYRRQFRSNSDRAQLQFIKIPRSPYKLLSMEMQQCKCCW